MPARFATCALVLLLCCATQRKVPLRPQTSRDLSSVAFLAFSSSSADGFLDGQGRPCTPMRRERYAFAGWSSDEEDPACVHDTFDHGPQQASLELRWRGIIPADGSYEVISGGYSLGAWGYVVARASYHGDYWAWARVIIDVQSASCRGTWALDLAKATITGEATRGRLFSGWLEIPDIPVSGCKAGDGLEVRVQLLAQSNRGAIRVEAFGFWAPSKDELNRLFGIRPRQAADPAAPLPIDPGVPPLLWPRQMSTHGTPGL